MNFTKYENYKNSGLDWLGDIPADWKTERNKEVFFEVSQKSETGEEMLLTVSHITGVTPRSEKNVNMFFAETMEGYKVCKTGDLLINTMWAWMGALGTSNYEGICSPAYGIYRQQKRMSYNHRYFDYLFKTPNFILEMTRYSKGIVASRLRLYATEFFQIKTPLPSYRTQTAIAEYLDEKTLQIDKKIELLQAKKSKYQELRKTLINDAVTKGLDKNVELKDSGVSWLGQIPQHWEVRRFKEICIKTHTGWTPSDFDQNSDDGDNIWVTIRDMNSTQISDSKTKINKKHINDSNIKLTPKGSLLFSFKLSIGKVAFASVDLYTNEAILTVEKQRKIDLHYLFYIMPIYIVRNAKENIYGAKLLNQDLIFNSKIIIPNLSEQTEITSYLDEKTSKIDAITGLSYKT